MTANPAYWPDLYQRFQKHTMIWEPVFHDNLRLCRQYHQPGLAVVECGVWKGGMIAAIAALLADEATTYHLFDSFEGLPEVQPIDGPAARAWQEDKDSPMYHDNCRASLKDAREAMDMAGALKVQIHPGWFEDTLQAYASPVPISILRLDADWHASTMICLEKLFPRMADKGLLIIDDYYTWDGCSRAVHEYLARHNRPERIHQTEREVAYIIKQGD